MKWSERHLKFKIPEDSKQQLQKNQLCVVGKMNRKDSLKVTHFNPFKGNVAVRINFMVKVFHREALFRFYRAFCFNKIPFSFLCFSVGFYSPPLFRIKMMMALT